MKFVLLATIALTTLTAQADIIDCLNIKKVANISIEKINCQSNGLINLQGVRILDDEEKVKVEATRASASAICSALELGYDDLIESVSSKKQKVAVVRKGKIARQPEAEMYAKTIICIERR